MTADLAKDDPGELHDGFYREQKRALAEQAGARRASQGPRVEPVDD